jgi:hypothetical protein
MATLLAIKQRVLRHFNQQDEALAGLPVPMSSTGTAASASSIKDTKLARASTSDANHFDKRYIEIAADAGAGPAVGEISVIADGGYDLLDDLTLDFALSAAPIASDAYLIYARGLSPTSVAQYINDTLRLTQGPHLWFPTLVSDGNFEASTAWSEIAGSSLGTAPNFLTAAADMLFGERSLNAISDAADEGMHSATFRVHENMTLLVSVTARAEVGTWDVELYRETATAAVTKSVTISDETFTEVRFQEAVPAGAEEMRIRFTSNGTTDEIDVSPPIIVQPQGWHAYPAPSWLTAPKAQLVQAREMPQGMAGTESDVYLALTMPPVVGHMEVGYRSDNWVTPNFITVETRSRPTYFVVKRAYDELSALTDTTNCDEDYLTYSAISRIYDDRGEEEKARKWGLRAAEIARAKGYGTEGFRIVPNPLAVV